MPTYTSLKHQLSAALAEAWLRTLNASRYPGELFMQVLVPIVLAVIPLLLGRASGGADAAANFAANTGTDNYRSYMLIGACLFMVVSNSLWNIAYWLRFEQETGTFEAIYLTPTASLTLLFGVALYSTGRSTLAGLLSYFIGSLLFGVNPLAGNGLLALVFILVGLIPLYGVSFLFGALVLKVKESNALVSLMQWVVSLLMGMYFPVAALPPLVRGLALLFPPTWMANGARAAILDLNYFLRAWYLDMAMLWVFLAFMPLFSFWVFNRVEQGLKRNEGVGEF
jgi:ABC-2 type transport system permease protein